MSMVRHRYFIYFQGLKPYRILVTFVVKQPTYFSIGKFLFGFFYCISAAATTDTFIIATTQIVAISYLGRSIMADYFTT